jgi:hypothetical protein
LSYLHTHEHTQHTHTHARTNARMHKPSRIHPHARTNARMHARTHTYTHTHAHTVCVFVCVFVCVCVCVCCCVGKRTGRVKTLNIANTEDTPRTVASTVTQWHLTTQDSRQGQGQGAWRPFYQYTTTYCCACTKTHTACTKPRQTKIYVGHYANLRCFV